MGKTHCGCTVAPGMTLTVDDLERHYQHTMECLLYWEIILGTASDPTVREKASEARIAIGEFVERRKQDVDPIMRAMGMA